MQSRPGVDEHERAVCGPLGRGALGEPRREPARGTTVDSHIALLAATADHVEPHRGRPATHRACRQADRFRDEERAVIAEPEQRQVHPVGRPGGATRTRLEVREDRLHVIPRDDVRRPGLGHRLRERLGRTRRPQVLLGNEIAIERLDRLEVPSHRGHCPFLVPGACLEVVGDLARLEVHHGTRRVRAHEIGDVRVIRVDRGLRLAHFLQPRGEAVHRIVVRLRAHLWMHRRRSVEHSRSVACRRTWRNAPSDLDEHDAGCDDR